MRLAQTSGAVAAAVAAEAAAVAAEAAAAAAAAAMVAVAVVEKKRESHLVSSTSVYGRCEEVVGGGWAISAAGEVEKRWRQRLTASEYG